MKVLAYYAHKPLIITSYRAYDIIADLICVANKSSDVLCDFYDPHMGLLQQLKHTYDKL